MKKYALCALSAAILSISMSAQAQVPKTDVIEELPIPYEVVFSTAMNDPNVMIYYANTMYRDGNFNGALKWMLEASQYEHSAAIENVKYMIQHNLGTLSNREGVISFLEFFAQPRGDQSADLFAQRYLADYYSGDKCVWLSNKGKRDCESITNEPMAASDYQRSYFYYEAASQQGDQVATYKAGMMNVLGLGVPRNVPLGVNFLEGISEKGNTSASFIIGAIYQNGYWLPQDKAQATKWFEKAAEVNHPASLMYLAKNAQAGIADGSESVRLSTAINAYETIKLSVLSSYEQKAEAAYRLGRMYDSNPSMKDDDKAVVNMRNAADFGKRKTSEYSVKALSWFASRLEKSNLAGAVEHYKEAWQELKKLPLDVQQRNSSVIDQIAYAYGRGQEGNLDRDERMFSFYMKERHLLMAKSYVPAVNPTMFEGFSAFGFSG
jgi:TPR repeat protein